MWAVRGLGVVVGLLLVEGEVEGLGQQVMEVMEGLIQREEQGVVLMVVRVVMEPIISKLEEMALL